MRTSPAYPLDMDVYLTVFLRGLCLEYRAHPAAANLFLNEWIARYGAHTQPLCVPRIRPASHVFHTNGSTWMPETPGYFSWLSKIRYTVRRVGLGTGGLWSWRGRKEACHALL